MDKLSLITGKLTSKALKLLKKKGGSLPGKMAINLSPSILKRIQYPTTTILVTGTNGKTTTANLIAKILRKSGLNLVNNANGDNIIFGVLTTLINSCNMQYKIDKDALVIEIDELTMAQWLCDIKASHIVITNFFRDQLDRAGEMENIIAKIEKALENYTGTLILNADDPNVYRLANIAKNAKIITFGIDHIDDLDRDLVDVKEGKFCPVCDKEIVYKYYQYSHIGNYKCSQCSFKRPNPDHLGTNVNLSESTMRIKENKFYFSISTTYHLYNCMASYALINCLGIDDTIFSDVVKNFNLDLGRMEYVGEVLINLIKNPTGANEVFRYIKRSQNPKAILFLLNDNVADGRDVSWIWDMDVSNIDNLDIVICTGKRAYEMAIRFKYAGYKNIVVFTNIHLATKELMKYDYEKYAISNYTGLLQLRKEIMHEYKTSLDV